MDERVEDKDLRSGDGNSETGGVQTACSAQRDGICDLVALAFTAEALLSSVRTVSKRSHYTAAAVVCTVPRKHSDGDEGAGEEDVEDDAEECEEHLAAKEAGEQDREDGVQDSGSREALDGLGPIVDGRITVGEDRQEVTVDAEDDSSAAEFEGIEEGLYGLEGRPAESHGDDWCVGMEGWRGREAGCRIGYHRKRIN